MAQLLHLNRNTVNHLDGQFREAIYLHQLSLKRHYFGDYEVDESYFGARRQRGVRGKLKRGRGTRIQSVFGVFERQGRAYTEMVPDCRKKTLPAVILGKISIDSIIYSDGWRWKRSTEALKLHLWDILKSTSFC